MMRKHNKRILEKKEILLISLVLVLIMSATTHAANSYQVTASGYSLIAEWSTPFYVTNSCSLDLFIPTKTAGEMNSAIANEPGCATVTASTCTSWSSHTTYNHCGTSTLYGNQGSQDLCSAKCAYEGGEACEWHSPTGDCYGEWSCDYQTGATDWYATACP